MKQWFEHLSSVEKTGKWMSLYVGDVYEDYCFCSKYHIGFKIKTNYCPNCGMKMEDEDGLD